MKFALNHLKEDLLHTGAVWWRDLKQCGLYADAIAWIPSDTDFQNALAKRQATSIEQGSISEGSASPAESVTLDFDDAILQELELLQEPDDDLEERDLLRNLDSWHIDDHLQGPPLKRVRL